MTLFARYSVLDAAIVGTKKELALSEVISRVKAGEGGYACFVNAHVSVMTRQRADVRYAVNTATFAFPDGKPVYLIGKYLDGLDIEKISGPDFMADIFESKEGRALRHFFYGGTPEVLDRLTSLLVNTYPGANIVGVISPPFRPLTEKEQLEHLDVVRASQAQIVWVGLGAPKQELWMHDYASSIPQAMFMGVGAAFDFHAGTLERAPEWAQKWGFEWFYRLIKEPRRLWRRYLTTNSLFIYHALKDRIFRRPSNSC